MTCLDRSGPDREALMHELDLTDPDIAARRDYSEARTLTRHTSPGPEPRDLPLTRACPRGGGR